jgi:hypothetical protein
MNNFHLKVNKYSFSSYKLSEKCLLYTMQYYSIQKWMLCLLFLNYVPVFFFWQYWHLDLGLHTWAMPLSLFGLVVLEIGSSFLSRVAWTTILLFYEDPVTAVIVMIPASLVWQVHATMPSFFPLKWEFHKLFCLSWSWPIILLISASSVAWDDR